MNSLVIILKKKLFYQTLRKKNAKFETKLSDFENKILVTI